MTDVECTRCQTMIDSEQAWIADEGILCKYCCRILYSDKFSTESKQEHTHAWKPYVNFNHVYEVCDCGQKRFAS